MEFISIDFETANSSPASPCAVGLVRVSDGQIAETLSICYFDHLFQITGSTKETSGSTESSPRMSWMPLSGRKYSQNYCFSQMVCHFWLTMPHSTWGVLRASAAAVSFDLPNLSYGCTLLMARKTYNLESYRLNAVAYAIGHEEFAHHDALADADACARIALDMANRHEVDSLEDLLIKTKQRFKPLLV